MKPATLRDKSGYFTAQSAFPRVYGQFGSVGANPPDLEGVFAPCLKGFGAP
jgi:hypothetical protein